MRLPQGPRSLLSRWAHRPLAVCAAVVLPLALAGGGALAAQAALTGARPAPMGSSAMSGGSGRPVVRTALRHDLSRPLRSMTPVRAVPGRTVRFIPNPNPLAGRARRAAPAAMHARTAGVQRTAGPHAMPAFGQNFEGIDLGAAGNPCPCAPPDTNLAVGPGDVVQAVNTSFAVWSKTGQLRYGPVDLGTIWQGLGGACDPLTDPGSYDGGDVIVMYDEAADRWFLSQLSYPGLGGGSGGFHNCIAVSQTGDPAGAWYRYDFLASSTELNDYPKFAVWPDAYYMTVNDFGNNGNGGFTGVTAVAFDRAAMLAGQQATEVSFTSANPNDAYLLPSNWEGAALSGAPPPGAPDPFWMSCDAHTGGPCTSDQLDEWDFHVDWSNPAASTFGNNGAPNLTLPTQDWNGNMCNASEACIPQPGTSQGLDDGGDKVMYQAAFRDIGGTGHVVLSQTVNTSASPPTTTQAGINWYELTGSGPGWAIADQGTYAPGSDNRFMPSANIDVSGDLAVGYSVSSSATFPSIAVAGRLAGDPAGQLAQGEQTLITGSGSQTLSQNGRGRWGDYSAMQADPADGCTFWYTTEYYATTADNAWQTRIGSFRYPSCTTGPHGTLTGTVTDAATGKPLPGATISTSTGSSTVTDPQGHYTITLPPGSYTLTATGPFGYPTTTVNGVAITDGATTTENFPLAPLPPGTLSGTVTDGSGHGWPLHAQITVENTPLPPLWTSPYTGAYSITLPQGSYTLDVSTDYPGYQAKQVQVTVGSGTTAQNIPVDADLTACTAPGYGPDGLTQGFAGWTGGTPREGWTVMSLGGAGWRFDDPGNRTSPPSGSIPVPGTHYHVFTQYNPDTFAVADAGYYNPQPLHTTLTSPPASLAGQSEPEISFDSAYYPDVPPGPGGAGSGQEGHGGRSPSASVQLSADGGRTWATVWHQTASNALGPITIPIPQAAGDAAVQARWVFTGGGLGYWAVGDVLIGTPTCAPEKGGLVAGIVTAQPGGSAVNGAQIGDAASPPPYPWPEGISLASADPALPGGFYWLFTPAGSQQLTATASGYASASATVNVAADQVTRHDWALTAAGGT